MGKFMRPYLIRSLSVLLLTFMGLGFGLLPPLLMVRIIDAGIQRNSAHMLLVLVAICALAIAAMRASRVAAQLVSMRIHRKIFVDLRLSLYRRLQVLDMHYFKQRHSAELLTRITFDVDNMESLLTRRLINVLSNFVVIIAVFIMMSRLSWQLTLLSLGIIPLFVITYLFLARGAFTLSKKVQKGRETLLSTLKDDIASIQLMKLFNLEKHRSEIISSHINVMEQSRMQLSVISSLASLSEAGINIAGILILWGIGGYLIIKGITTLGVIVGFSGLYSRIHAPLQSLFTSYFSIHSSLASAERVFEVLDAHPRIDLGGGYELNSPPEMIRFSHITFSYDKDKTPIFQNLSLCIPRGSSVALVGSNGSGKTTFLNLLLRLYDPDEGDIFIDEVCLRDYALHTVRQHIGFVSQDPFFFDDTVHYNLTLGRTDLTIDQIHSAVSMAHALDLIESLPLGYETRIGENGVRLSTGQKQRLAIARALIGEPWILVFDEPSANIDLISQNAILESIKTLCSNHKYTLIMVTHSPEMLRFVDAILLFESGNVKEISKADCGDIGKDVRLFADMLFRSNRKYTAEGVNR
jgi:ABC-type multidrug transport system fused ATPase/permease subunit